MFHLGLLCLAGIITLIPTEGVFDNLMDTKGRVILPDTLRALGADCAPALVRAVSGVLGQGDVVFVAAVDAVSGRCERLLAEGMAAVLPQASIYDEVLAHVRDTALPDGERDTFFDTLHLSEMVYRLADGVGRFTCRYRFAVGQDGPRWHEISFSSISGSNAFLVSARDVQRECVQEEQARLREEHNKRVLAEAMSIADEANKARGTFLSFMSDALLEPYSAILSLTTLMRGDPSTLSASLDKIDTAAQYGTSLLRDCLEAARTTQGAAGDSTERFALRGLADEIQAIGADARAKGQSFIFDESALPADDVTGNRAAIVRIIEHLGENAVNFTPPGGRIEVTCEEKYRSGGMIVVNISICDNGVSIGEDFEGRAFEPFLYEQQNTPGVTHGMGLGLPITQKYADLIGAVVSLGRGPGGGTVASIDIPLRTVGENTRQIQRTVEAPAPTVSLSGRHILLAEDNELNAEIISALLTLNGMQVDLAVNGLEAVNFYAGKPAGAYDAVLMDIQMPVMDGLEAAQCIRRAGRPDSHTIPIIAISANAFQEELARALSSGMNDFIIKPIALETLMASLRAHIAASDAARGGGAPA